MDILLTGASGQLGRELTDFLLGTGNRITTLGRRAIDGEIRNYAWSLGMSPNPQAFTNVDCILHLAWSTIDRGDYDFHLNVGGSAKIVNVSKLSGIKLINFSSLSALNPSSSYGKAKELVERTNSNGVNLRIAKIEKVFIMKDVSFFNKLWREIIFIPIPIGLSIQVTEIDHMLEEIEKYIKGDWDPGVYTLSYESYGIGEYLKKYHGLRSFPIPKSVVGFFFSCCKFSRTRKGKILYDRWISMVSTDKTLRKNIKSS
jgi:hypothetical protein